MPGEGTAGITMKALSVARPRSGPRREDPLKGDAEQQRQEGLNVVVWKAATGDRRALEVHVDGRAERQLLVNLIGGGVGLRQRRHRTRSIEFPGTGRACRLCVWTGISLWSRVTISEPPCSPRKRSRQALALALVHRRDALEVRAARRSTCRRRHRSCRAARTERCSARSAAAGRCSAPSRWARN